MSVFEQEHMELEKRYRELTDLLVNLLTINYIVVSISPKKRSQQYSISNYFIYFQYYKQTQLETMASEKAAAEFQLEKEVKRLQEAHVWTCYTLH